MGFFLHFWSKATGSARTSRSMLWLMNHSFFYEKAIYLTSDTDSTTGLKPHQCETDRTHNKWYSACEIKNSNEEKHHRCHHESESPRKSFLYCSDIVCLLFWYNPSSYNRKGSILCPKKYRNEKLEPYKCQCWIDIVGLTSREDDEKCNNPHKKHQSRCCSDSTFIEYSIRSRLSMYCQSWDNFPYFFLKYCLHKSFHSVFVKNNMKWL